MTTTKKPTNSRRSKTNSAPSDPATDYARAVVAGEVVAGLYVRQACQRHLDDLIHGHERGLSWRPDKAQALYNFFGLLRHSKGRWAGQSFTLDPWQCFFVGSLWGWRRQDGTRRFRTAHLEVARKNGKTTVASGLGLALLLGDDEPGAEVYTTATKLEQARITHEESKLMAKGSPSIRASVEIYRDSITAPSLRGKYVPLGKDSGTLDGLNISGAICDELHAWKDPLLWDVIRTGMRARSQPLTVITTTAGFDTHSLWYRQRQQAVRMLDGTTTDDDLFALIYTLDRDDDWKDPAVWVKGNPNLGVTFPVDELQKDITRAINSPGEQLATRRLYLNEITDAAQTWIEAAHWDGCRSQLTEDDLVGRPCITGLDLSSSRDLTAAVHWFPFTPAELDGGDGEEMYYAAVGRFWLPEDGIREKGDADGVNYEQWAEDGWLNLIPGPSIKYEFVEKQIMEDLEKFQHRMVVVDRYLAVQTAERLGSHGLTVLGYGQGYISMAGPVVEFERCVASRRFLDLGNPVLRWCALNVVVDQDPAGNRKPTKRKSTGRIDGVVALLMALGGMMAEPWDSVYNRGESLSL